MGLKRVIKLVGSLLLLAVVVWILHSVLKDKSLGEYGSALFNVVKVFIGLCLLIFFHELGHFLAAKACGVRVETFSIGLGPAIPGCEFRYGETYYKIAQIPLGGYVKMLGQTDPGEKEEDEAAARESPRSYMNKTVGQRMIIISAGVIMNVLLGMACFVYVYLAGKVEKVPRLGTIAAGSPAQRAGLEAGSKLLAVDDNTHPIYEDLFFASLLANPGSTQIYLKWQTPSGEVHDAEVTPMKGPNDIKPSVGVGFPFGLQVPRRVKDAEKLTMADSPAARAGLQTGDKFIGVRIKGADRFEPLNNGWDLTRAEDQWRRETLEFLVKRDDSQVPLTVEPAYFRTPGFYLTMGAIRTLPEYQYAPASARQFEIGDVIVAIDGVRDFDPLRLPDLMRDRSEQGQEVRLTVRRKEQEKELAIPAADLAKRGTWTEVMPSGSSSSMGILALGISYDVLPRISFVEPKSPAEAAGLKPGDELVTVTLHASKGDNSTTIKLGKTNWSAVFWSLQDSSDKKQVDFTYKRNDAEQLATVELRPDPTWPLPVRGFITEFDTQTLTAESFSQAIYLGFRETYRDIIRMYMSLKSVMTGNVSAGTFSGPVGIAEMAYKTAEQGFTDFMFLVGFISINLAVVNFLPIPVLDGGHMVFLFWEKIRGRPASERAMAIANTVGLVFIFSLLCFVLFLDLGGRRFFFGN